MPTRLHSASLPKIATLLLCGLVFLLIPLKVGSFGYLPPDDALRHAAFAVDHRNWNEVLLLNPRINAYMDSHPGWHAVLRWLHQDFGFSVGDLVFFSFTATFVLFSASGLIFSGSPVAWLLACLLTMMAEGGLFSRLLLGRPFAVSIAGFVALLFLWTRDKPIKISLEIGVALVLVTTAICVHPTVWYMWSVPAFILLICRRWRSFLIISVCIPLAMVLAGVITGNWYSIFIFPISTLFDAFGTDYILGTSLVGEFQPSGGPVLALIVVSGFLAVKHFKGYSLRDEFKSVDFCLILVMWVLGLKIMRFWADWGIPAFTVWSCRQLILLRFDQLPRPRETFIMTAAAAASLYLGLSADVGGRYTYNLKSPVLTHPVAEYRSLLPEAGGILYTIEMTLFYRLYYRIPDAPFRFSTGFEPGLMPPEDLKVMRGIQFNDGLIKAYEPWLNKMTTKDRVMLFYPGKPEWPGFEFSQFYTMWVGRKLTAQELAKVAEAKTGIGLATKPAPVAATPPQGSSN